MKTSPASSITLPETEAAAADAVPVEDSRAERLRQFTAIFRLSFRRYFGSRLFWVAGMLAFLPVIISGFIMVLMLLHNDAIPVNEYFYLSEKLYIAVYLHFGVFFAAGMFGGQLLREELEERTLHHYYLQPVPRWLFVLGKFAAALAITAPLFIIGHTISRIMAGVPMGFGPAVETLITRDHAVRLLAEYLVIILGLTMYGALFAAIGSVLKSALYAVFLYGWEIGNNYMPDAMNDFSIIYHLKGILPYQTSDRAQLIAVMSDGPGVLQIILVLGFFFAATFGFTCWIARRKQCLYGS
jgi:hypothetical protein